MVDFTFETQPNFHSLIDLLQHRLNTSPQHTPYIFLADDNENGIPVTYVELLHAIHGIAANLQTQTSVGDRVLLLYPPGLQYITAFFGTIFAGCLPVPLYPPRNNRSIERVQTVANDAQAKIALATPNIIAKINRITAKSDTFAKINLLNFDETIIAKKTPQWRNPHRTADDIAFLQYTSGSTAAPKGVMVTHKNLLLNSSYIQQFFQTKHGVTGVSWLPPYHDMGLIGGILQPIFCDGTSVLMSPLDFVMKPIRWLNAISKYKAKINSAPNFAFDLCVEKTMPEDRTQLDLSHWKYANVGAEPVRAETLARFTETFAPYGFNASAFVPCYGLAEATLIVSAQFQTQDPTIRHFSAEAIEKGLIEIAPTTKGRTQSFVGCGSPIPNHKIVIVNPQTQMECAPNEIGEVWISGESVAKGYWQKPDVTQSTFNARYTQNNADSFLRTGDLGFFHEDELFITGRIKDLIILQGRNYYPQDIELTAEKSHSALQENGCAAFSVDVENQEKLVVVQEVQRTAIKHIDSNEVIKKIRRAIVETYEIYPYAIVLVKPMAVPKTSSGKIQHFACRKMYQDSTLKSIAEWVQPKRAQTHNENIALQYITPPRNPIENTLVEIWTDVLEIDFIGVHDDFFQWGGDSLSATQVVSRIHHIFNVSLSLEALFNITTIAQLATLIEKMLQSEQINQAISIKSISRDQLLPTAFSQERMWFIQQLQPKNSAYNIVVPVKIVGKLDIAAMIWALNSLVARHESLRTVITVTNGIPYQQILSELYITPVQIDLRHLDVNMREPRATELAHAHAKEPFDLSQAPYLRALLIQLEENLFWLQVTIHHAVFDAWSSGVFGRELLEFYQSHVEHRNPNLPKLNLQYADFAYWQRQWLQGDILTRQLNYWTKQINAIPILSLPTDRPRPAIQTMEGSFVSIEDLSNLFANIKKFSWAHNVTPFMTFLATFELLIYRYTLQTDFGIGVPIANRHHLDSESIIGTLVNTLVIRSKLDEDLTFLDLLRVVKETTLAAYANQDLPFEKLVSIVNPNRDLNHTPLFQVMLDYINVATPNRKFSNLTWEMLDIDRGGAQFDMTLIIVDTKEAQSMSVEYNTDLFDEATITRFLTHFITLLNDVITRPNTNLPKFNLLPDSERSQILEDWNNTHLEYPKTATLPQLIERQAQKTPSAIAVRGECNCISLTYEDLINRAEKVARYLRQFGANTGDYVGIGMHRTPDMLVALLGILKAGCAYIPLDHTFPQKRLAFMLKDTNAQFIITHANLTPFFKEGAPAATFIEFDNDWDSIEAEHNTNVPLPALTANNLAYIIYTSGSTGTPKGVQVSHRNVVHFLYAMLDKPTLNNTDIVLSVTSLSFDPSVLELFLPLLVGAKLVQATSEVAHNGRKLIETLAMSNATVMQATPTTWRMLIDAGWRGDPYLKILCGGEALLPDMASELLSRVGELWNVYGPTETTVWATIAPITSATDITIGKPVANMQCYILDTEHKPVPIGVAGELYIGGNGVTQGYLNRPQLTDDHFIQNSFNPNVTTKMYRTGDLARYRPNGDIEFLGRIDYQVKVRGFRIELGEIETLLNQHEHINQAVVTAFQHDHLAAYIIPDGDRPSITDLRQFLLNQLPDYMVPAYFTFLSEFPLTPNKKIDRKALPAPELVRPNLAQTFMAPQNDTELRLGKIWEDLLQITPIGIDDNFFDLGGHSLIALHLFEQIEATFGVNIPLTVLFQDSTIRALAKYIIEKQSPQWSSLVEIESEGTKYPFFCIHGITGDILWFRELAHEFAPMRPFYGLQAIGLDGNPPDFMDIPQIATTYLKEIRQKQPTGPYFLGGASFGGTVALEMAQQLLSQGETVGLLAIFDHAPPNVQYVNGLPSALSITQIKNLLQNLPNWLRDIQQMGISKLMARLRRKIRVLFHRTSSQNHLPSASDIIDYAETLPVHRQKLIEQHYRALSQYSPKPINTKVLLLRAKSRPLFNLFNPEFAWQQLAKQSLVVRDISGSHERMFISPNAQILAQHLKDALDEIQP